MANNKTVIIKIKRQLTPRAGGSGGEKSREGFKSDLRGWKPQFSLSLNRHQWNSCPSRLFFL